MSRAHDHIIGRTEWVIDSRRLEQAWELQEVVGRVFAEQAQPAMAALFDRLFGEEAVVRLDRLELDLGPLSADTLEADLTKRLLEKLEEHLLRHQQQAKTDQAKLSPAAHQWELLTFFLQHGHFPWWQPVVERAELVEGWKKKLLASGAGRRWGNELRALLQQHPAARHRLVSELPAAVWEALLLADRPDWQAAWTAVQKQAKALARNLALSTTLARQADFSLSLALVEAWLGAGRDTSLAAGALVVAWGKEARSAWRQPLLDQLSEAPPGSENAYAAWLSEAIARLLPALSPSEQETWTQGLVSLAKAEAELSWRWQKARESGENPVAASSQESRTEGEQVAKEGGAEEADAAGPGLSEMEKAGAEAETTLAEAGTQAVRDMDRHKDLLRAAGVKLDAAASAEGLDAAAAKRGWYVPNAGLVLLHPFLPGYFRAIGLLDEADGWATEAARQQGMYLLHFLASGAEDAPEYELLLPKLLLGWPLEAPVRLSEPLSGEMMAEGERLLQAVLDHWGALGRSSPDGLREGFLRRPGKLSLIEHGWKLQVETHAIDVLLSRLPWGVGMVKTGWMEDFLSVQWS